MSSGEETVSSAPKRSKGPVILVLVNTLAIAGVAGLMVYTRLLYKRPAITEHSERAKLAQSHAVPAKPASPGVMRFDPITVNIESDPSNPKPAEQSNQAIQGKLHYASIEFYLELRDEGQKEKLEAVRAILVDKVISMLGKTNLPELITIQGRYVLKTKIMDEANKLAKTEGGASDPLVSNVFFTNFVVQ